MTPIRIQRSRQHKQVSPNGLKIIYCGRGSRWGNPFRVEPAQCKKWTVKTKDPDCFEILTSNCKPVYDTKEEAVDDAIKCYGLFLFPYNHETGTMDELLLSQINEEAIKEELKGHNLSCWCKLDEKCHVDLLLKIANEG